MTAKSLWTGRSGSCLHALDRSSVLPTQLRAPALPNSSAKSNNAIWGTTPRRNKERLQKFLAYLVRAMPLYFWPRLLLSGEAGGRAEGMRPYFCWRLGPTGGRAGGRPRYFCWRLGRAGRLPERAGGQAASVFLLATRAGGRADRLPERAGGQAASVFLLSGEASLFLLATRAGGRTGCLAISAGDAGRAGGHAAWVVLLAARACRRAGG